MTRRRLITERDVRRARDEKLVELDVRGAAVTPSAIDLAHRIGILLSGLVNEQKAVRRSGKPAVPESPEGRTRQPEPGPGAAPASGASVPVDPVRRVACGADHGGVKLKDAIVTRLRELGHSVVDQGTQGTDAVDYPDFAVAVARSVASGAAEFGIMVDGAGIGSCMAANKVRGVRAAMCYDLTTAHNAREHNNANVLTLGGGLLGERLALAIVEAFLDTPFAGGRHGPRVAKIDAIQG